MHSLLQNKNLMYKHAPFTHTYIHLDVHIIYGHQNGLARLVKGLSKDKTLGLGFELRQNGEISQTDWQ